ncbi:MAG: hypothetical protein ACKVOA_09330 [Methylophilaceae bacterium]
MATSSIIKSAEKIKLLDQMLEDIAGEEFDIDGGYGTDYASDLKRYSGDSQLGEIDNFH